MRMVPFIPSTIPNIPVTCRGKLLELIINLEPGFRYTNPLECPLAKAIQPLLKKEYQVVVGGYGHFQIRDKNKIVYKSQVKDIDRGIVVTATEPLVREVTIPEEYLV